MPLHKYIKSQTTIFIIIAIVIVVLTVIIILTNSKSSTINIGANNVDPEIRPIYSYVENCLGEVGVQAIDHTSQRGGYYILPELSTGLDIPYYIYDSKNIVPDLEVIQDQISLYIKDNINNCIDLTIFNDFKIENTNIKIETQIEDEQTTIQLKYNLAISKGDKNYELENFRSIIPIRLGTVYKASSEIVLEEIKNLELICIYCLNTIANENDLFIQTIDFSDQDLIITIRDENYKINNNDYIYNFAIQYI